MSKSRHQLDLEHRIALLEKDLDESGPSKWIEMDRRALLDELNQYLAEKADRRRSESKDERGTK